MRAFVIIVGVDQNNTLRLSSFPRTSREEITIITLMLMCRSSVCAWKIITSEYGRGRLSSA